MFDSLQALKTGNEKQKEAYAAINKLHIMKDLYQYHPTVCGTIPLDIHLSDSDIDIIFDVHDYDPFEKIVTKLYSHLSNYQVKRTVIREQTVVKANFNFCGFEFELFGQSQPVHCQNAYLHMVIEERILNNHPTWKEKIIGLKKQGYKTEPAFCQLLGLIGDPYEELILYGKKEGII
jgi:hypothetical protein